MLQSQIQLVDAVTEQPFAAAPQGAVQASSLSCGWRGILVEQHRILPMEMPEHYVQGHRLIVHLGDAVEYEWKQGNRWQLQILHPGEFCLQSHGDRNVPRWHDPFQFLAIALDPNFLSQSFQDLKHAESIRFREQRMAFDPIITQFAARFKAEIGSGSYCGALYGESLAIAFSLHLLEQHQYDSKSIDRPRGRLSSLQLCETIEFIHSHLAEDLSLTQLATHLNLSAFHFARLFKNSLGLSPHQYILQNRVERAKKLITVTSAARLTEIGLAVGFYDQTHFSKAFKRVVGVTPKAFAKCR